MFCCLVITTVAFGQTYSPVKWSFELISENEDSFKVRATADISDKWVIYSSRMEDDGPIPTSMQLSENIKTTGSLEEPLKSIKGYDDLFEMEVIKFSKRAVFEQKISPDPKLTVVKGYITFMTCDGLRCLPPQNIPFSLPIKR